MEARRSPLLETNLWVMVAVLGVDHELGEDIGRPLPVRIDGGERGLRLRRHQRARLQVPERLVQPEIEAEDRISRIRAQRKGDNCFVSNIGTVVI